MKPRLSTRPHRTNLRLSDRFNTPLPADICNGHPGFDFVLVCILLFGGSNSDRNISAPCPAHRHIQPLRRSLSLPALVCELCLNAVYMNADVTNRDRGVFRPVWAGAEALSLLFILVHLGTKYMLLRLILPGATGHNRGRSNSLTF
jgi:hypothetical protein